MKLPDFTGKRFGRLLVKEKHPESDKWNKIQWVCVCDCGNTRIITGSTLNRGTTQSCGCLRRQVVGDLRRTHGLSRSPEYEVWRGVLDRCYNEKHPSYPDYGGRGITVCDEWKESFEVFYHDMGPRPSSDYSIERDNNELGYSCGNCRWVTRSVQANNRRNSLHYEHLGEKLTLAQWCQRLNLSYNRVYRRIKILGWTFIEAIRPIEDELVTYDGTTLSLQNWCGLLGLKLADVCLRYMRGTPFKNIVEEKTT